MICICLIRIQTLSFSQISILQNNSFFLVFLYKKTIFINKLVSLILCCSFIFHQFCLISTRAIRYRSSLTRISLDKAHSHTFWSRVHRARIIANSGGPILFTCPDLNVNLNTALMLSGAGIADIELFNTDI